MREPGVLAAAASPTGGENNLLVLVADASPTVQKVVRLTLQREQIRVIAASDSLSALAAAADETPSVILLDTRLPRMGGYSVCRMLRDNTRFRHVPIIMLGRKDEPLDQFRGRFAGSSGYLAKPFDAVELMRAVKEHL